MPGGRSGGTWSAAVEPPGRTSGPSNGRGSGKALTAVGVLGDGARSLGLVTDSKGGATLTVVVGPIDGDEDSTGGLAVDGDVRLGMTTAAVAVVGSSGVRTSNAELCAVEAMRIGGVLVLELEIGAMTIGFGLVAGLGLEGMRAIDVFKPSCSGAIEGARERGGGLGSVVGGLLVLGVLTFVAATLTGDEFGLGADDSEVDGDFLATSPLFDLIVGMGFITACGTAAVVVPRSRVGVLGLLPSLMMARRISS